MYDAIEDSIFANCISDGTPIVAVQLEGKLHDLSAAIKTVGAELLAILAQLRAVLQQTLLNRVVVAQLLPAKSLCVSRARLLLLRGAHMALSQ